MREVEPATARDKSIGEANDLFADRRPELYSVLTERYEATPLAKVMDEAIVPDRMVRQIAAIQVSAPGEPDDVLQAAIAQCIEAQRNHGVDLGVLPEHFLFDPAAIADDPQIAAEMSAKALAQLRVSVQPHRTMAVCASCGSGRRAFLQHRLCDRARRHRRKVSCDASLGTRARLGYARRRYSGDPDSVRQCRNHGRL